MPNETMVLMVVWDRQGMPQVQAVTPGETLGEVVHALGLAAVVVGQTAVQEAAHWKALAERADQEATGEE